jgi:hypothetical protein
MKKISTLVIAVSLVLMAVSCGGRKDRCPSVGYKTNTSPLITNNSK